MLITVLGTRTSSDGAWRIGVSETKLEMSRYESANGVGWSRTGWTTDSPDGWKAQPGWFVFIESDERVWAYDCDRLLLLLNSIGDHGPVSGPTRFSVAVPHEVHSRLSEAAQRAIEPSE